MNIIIKKNKKNLIILLKNIKKKQIFLSNNKNQNIQKCKNFLNNIKKNLMEIIKIMNLNFMILFRNIINKNE